MQRSLGRQLLTVPGRCVRLVSDLALGVRRYRLDWVTLLRRLALLRLRCRINPREALEGGLLDPGIRETALSVAISKRALVRLLSRVNPDRYDCLTEDKSIFYAYCGALGLPVPRLYGVVAWPVGFSAEGQPLLGATQWQSFAAALPDEFVVKPSQGVYGRGVEIFRRDGSDFIGSSSGRHASEAVHTAFCTDPRYTSFVIQERLWAHAAIQELTGTPCLQTLRMVTNVDDQGGVDIVYALLRVIGGAAIVDNFDGGQNGNLLSFVDLGKGSLETAWATAPGGIGLRQVTHHPRTGVPFQDFRLPDWEPACALARRAALLFLPMRTLGWDIALASGGPRIVEVNKRWDPCNELAMHDHNPSIGKGMIELLAKLRKAPHNG
jgi:Sugar-transfer associated ATP-grasp